METFEVTYVILGEIHTKVFSGFLSTSESWLKINTEEGDLILLLPRDIVLMARQVK